MLSLINKESVAVQSIAAGTSMLSVVATKICCWGPALAALSGSAGYLAWLRPMRPYLTVMALFSLGYSHYNAYIQAKNKKAACLVCGAGRVAPLKSKIWLWLLTAWVLGSFFYSY